MNYDYNIGDFPYQKVDLNRLTQEIQRSAITIALDYCSTVGDVCSIFFKATLSFDEVALLDLVVSEHSGDALPDPTEADGTPIISLKARQSDGVPKVALASREGWEWVIGTHNFCDPCTWFGDSIRVEEALTDSGDGLTYTSERPYWIDMVSGRMHNDDLWVQIQRDLNPSDPHGYQVVVKVDGVVQQMREPFETSGGDYTVNFAEGTVTFFDAPSGVVTATYNYAAGSTFYVRPFPGTSLFIEATWCVTTNDVVMTDTLEYSVWDGTKLMAANFKRAGQILVEVQSVQPPYTAKGATTGEKQIEDMDEFRRVSRGMKYDRQVASFRCAVAKQLSGSREVRVKTLHDRPMVGENVTLTFSCIEKREG